MAKRITEMTTTEAFQHIFGRSPKHPYEVADFELHLEEGGYDSVEESRIICDCEHKFDIAYCDNTCGDMPKNPSDYSVSDDFELTETGQINLPEGRSWYSGAMNDFYKRQEELQPMSTRDPINPNAVKDAMSKAEALAQLTEVLVNRGADYGTPAENHGRAADLINAYLKHIEGPLDDTQTMVLMMLIKVARLIQTPDHVDSFMDIAGYAICAVDALNER